MIDKDTKLQHEIYLKSIKKRKISIKICRIFIVGLFFILWQLASNYGFIDTFFFSSPLKIIKTYVNLYNSHELTKHLYTTFYEVIISVTLSLLLGLVISILLWWWSFLRELIEPYLVAFNSMPKICLAPLIIFWLGNNIKSVIVLSVLFSVVPTIITLITEFISVDKNKINLINSFGGSKFQLLIYLVLPYCKLKFISMIKISLGLSWIGVIIGEFQVGKYGLGALITYGTQMCKLDIVMGAIVILLIICYLMYLCLDIFTNKYLNREYI